ncbi:MAG: ABC transporter ATP-binding protein [Betaproteobacteria bacterium]|nr:ABC transporter ATP-binding protein [Betaproteobacteria bacterium]MBI2961302.1 ABC transporter ATP-binding protein [Betaproteobacteria bacterium]
MSLIQLEKVCVDFAVFGASHNLRISLLQGLTGGRILPKSMAQAPVIVRALEDITLEIRSGERVGLLGHNGAGKSTLLRVLAGVYHPAAGRVTIRGKVTALLNLTPGLDVEDSGYENIITCGMLLGLSLEEIRAKAPQIIEFSELGDYIHLPARTYSSGMLTRLGFSIATALDPNILLLDEWLGAGDAMFNEKANRRIKEKVDETDIVIFASHSEALIESMCDKAALIHHGRLLEFGPVSAVRKRYRELSST